MWARFNYDVLENAKTYTPAQTLNIPVYGAAGLLACLWSWAVEKSDNGNIAEYREKRIEQVCHWDGEPGALIPVLIQCGWIDGSYDDDSLRIHDWMENGGTALQQSREKAAERQKRARVRKADASRVTVTRDCHRDGHSAKSQSQSQNQNQSVEPTTSATSITSRGAGGTRDLYAYFKQLCPMKATSSFNELRDLINQGFEEAAIRRMMELTADNGADHPSAYFKYVCADKAERGLFTLAAIEADEAAFAEQR